MSTDTREALASTPRAVWAMGDYALMAEQVMAPLGPVLVDFAGIVAGDKVLDVAAGSGNISVPAALRGARVVASDLTPELLRRAAQRTAEHSATLECRAHHQRAADELVRVCRSRGTIGLISWTPEGFFGQMLAAIRPYRPTLAPGVPLAALWGREDYIAGMLGDRVSEITAQRATLRVDRFRSAEECHEYFKNNYGPTINAYRLIGNNHVLAAALDAQLVDLARRHLTGGVMEWEYLILTARKR